MNVIEKDKEYIASTYARFPVVLEKGNGSLVYDKDGKEKNIAISALSKTGTIISIPHL